MNAIQKRKQHRVATWPRPHLPIICPACSAGIGVIDEASIENRYAWATVITQVDLSADDPHADVRAIHGECPACSAQLVALSVTFRGPAADGPREPRGAMPRLSLAMHGGAYSGWAMIESREGDVLTIEHLFEPRPARTLAGGIDFVRKFLLGDLPRPGYSDAIDD